ncbi:hypothetical protein HMPREF2572_04865 [Neisseria sp. HMSC064E01]|nr:hypothetical protein HMPREF2572_04865 [Neisseria sp. HMSC064E01]
MGLRGNAEPAVGRILVSEKNLPSQEPSDSRIRPTETKLVRRILPTPATWALFAKMVFQVHKTAKQGKAAAGFQTTSARFGFIISFFSTDFPCLP